MKPNSRTNVTEFSRLKGRTGRRRFYTGAFVKAAWLGLLILLALAVGLFAACGGEGDDGNGAPDAAPAATPSAPSNGGEAAPTTSAPSQRTPTTTETLEELVLPQEWKTFEVELMLGDVVVITYTSKPKAVGGFAESGGAGRPGVVFAVNDPFGDSLYRSEQIADGGYEFEAELNGVYELTFLNPVVRNLQEVQVEYTINP